MELYLIRHAQSLNNALPEEQRVPDPGLTELGHQQAQLLADWLPELQLTRLITSPFLRALETTEKIGETIPLQADVRVELHELGGCYSGHRPGEKQGEPGMNRREIEQRFPQYRVHPTIDGQGWWARQPYESWEQAGRRVSALMQQLQEEFSHSSERVALVMHADIMLRMLDFIEPDPQVMPYNTGITKIVIENDTLRLDEHSRVDHLPDEFWTR